MLQKSMLSGLKSYAEKNTLSIQDFTVEFHSLQIYFKEAAVIDRFLLNDTKMLVTGLSLSARFGYLQAISDVDGTYGRYDSMNVYNILCALASRDKVAVDAFLTRFKAPFKNGHRATVLLSNGVYAALDSNPESLLNLLPTLRERKESRFYRAMYDCLIAISDSNPHDVSSALCELIHGNRRQQEHLPMEKIVCIEAHAFYWLCAQTSLELLEKFDTQTTFPWDAEYNSFLKTLSPSSIGPREDITELNEVLGQWLIELPETLDCDELIASL